MFQKIKWFRSHVDLKNTRWLMKKLMSEKEKNHIFYKKKQIGNSKQLQILIKIINTTGPPNKVSSSKINALITENTFKLDAKYVAGTSKIYASTSLSLK